MRDLDRIPHALTPRHHYGKRPPMRDMRDISSVTSHTRVRTHARAHAHAAMPRNIPHIPHIGSETQSPPASQHEGFAETHEGNWS